MKTIFLGRTRPIIESAAEFLFQNVGTTPSDQSPGNSSCNLSNWLVVVPSLRTQRNLTAVLIQNAMENSVVLELPTIITVGRLPEKLYRQNRPLADPITQQLAWICAIRQTNLPDRKEFLPVLPKEDDLSASLMMGKLMVQLHTELAAEGLSFSDVVKKLGQWNGKSIKRETNSELPSSSSSSSISEPDNPGAANPIDLEFERRRWTYLIEVQKQYHKILDDLNLWDKQSARLYALAHPGPSADGLPQDFQINNPILLVGLVDLNRALKQILRRVEDKVTSLVFAPESESDGFDEWGALKVSYWAKGLTSPVLPNQIIQAEKPMDQALCAFDFIQSFKGKYSLDEITIGVPDPELVHFVERAGRRFHVKIDNSVGQPLNQTGPFLLLQAVANYLDQGDFPSLAALARHPAVYAALVESFNVPQKTIDKKRKPVFSTQKAEPTNENTQKLLPLSFDDPADDKEFDIEKTNSSTDNYTDPLTALDRFQSDRFPLLVEGRLKRKLIESNGCSMRDLATVRRVIQWTNDWLADWRNDRLESQDMGPALGRLFGELGTENPAFATSLDRQAKAQIIAAGSRLESVPSILAGGAITTQSALEMVIQSVETINLPVTEEDFLTPVQDADTDADTDSDSKETAAKADPDSSVIALTGWLELIWDRNPATVILSFNEGIVPQSSNGHLFLPNQLRRYLGIVDNDRRLARDAYYLRSITDSRKDLRIVFGLRGTDEQTLLPSRLLFNEKNPDLPNQVLNWFNDKGQKARYEFAPPERKTVPALRENRAIYDWAAQNLTGDRKNLVGLVTKLSATKFRDYIACPFRFYLKHVLKLKTATDSARELDAAGFGTLMHEVLEYWGQDEIKRVQKGEPTGDEETIRGQLNQILDERFQATFPDQVRPAVLLQKEIVRERCAAFAKLQANWEFGRVLATESSYYADMPLTDGAIMKLEGKIDRIDRSNDGTITLIDYKSYDQEKTPEKVHRPKADGPWKDLQLPVYRYVVQNNPDRFGLTDKTKSCVQTGLLLLPKNQRAKLNIANWFDSDYEDAYSEIRRISQDIFNGIFWPPNTEEVPFDDFKGYVDWVLDGGE